MLVTLAAILISGKISDTQSADSNFEIARRHQESGNLKQAEAYYLRAIDENPQSFEALYNVGLIYANLNDWGLAKNYFGRALLLQDDLDTIRNYLFSVLKLNQTPEAPKVELLVRLAGTDPGSHFVAGLSLLAIDRTAEASEELIVAHSLAPADVEIEMALARSLVSLSRTDEAARHLRAVLKSNPNHLGAKKLLVQIETPPVVSESAETPRPLTEAGAFLLFVGLASLMAALIMRRSDLWPQRKIAFGLAAIFASSGFALISNQNLLFGGLVWGIYQLHLARQFSRLKKSRRADRDEYLITSASVLAYLALADGQIAAQEYRVIRETYVRAGFGPEDVNRVAQTMRECEEQFRESGSDPNRLYDRLHASCEVFDRHSNEAIRQALYRVALLVVSADGYLSADERGLLQACGSWLGISPEDQRSAWNEFADDAGDSQGGAERDTRSRASSGREDPEGDRSRTEPVAPPDLATYYASILGITPEATPSEVKRAFRAKAKQYHPDTVSHLGSEYVRIAEEHFKKISEANRYFAGYSPS